MKDDIRAADKIHEIHNSIVSVLSVLLLIGILCDCMRENLYLRK